MQPLALPLSRVEQNAPSLCHRLQGKAGGVGCDQGSRSGPGTNPANGAREDLLFLSHKAQWGPAERPWSQ